MPLSVATRIDNYIVEISDTMETADIAYSSKVFGGKRCNQFDGQPPAYPMELFCQRGQGGNLPKGRYIYIYIPHVHSLNLCEVEVFGFRK